MPDRDPSAAGLEVGTLQAEIARLKKIVEALMDRAEAGPNVRGSDFGLFQTTIMLQDQVRLHTEELEAALRDRGNATGDSRESAARDMQTLRRTAALQIQLLELVVQQKNIGELVERVATILDTPIVLFNTRGHVVSSSQSAAGSPDLAARLWEAHGEGHGGADPDGAVTQAGERASFRDVVVMGRTERVLAAVTTRSGPTEFVGASLLFLQQLVTLDLLRGRDELRMRRRLRRGLLRDVLAGDGSAEELRVRLQAQGFDDESVLRIAIVEPRPQTRGDAPGAPVAERRNGGLLRALDAFLSRRRPPYLTTAKGSRAIVLTALSDEETENARILLGELREAAAPAVAPWGVVAGCSAPLTGIADATRGLQQAKAACLCAGPARDRPDIGIFETLTGHLRLLDGLDAAALSDIVQRTFAPLLDYDAKHRAGLYETLRTLFAHSLAVQETADALHIHRNTLQKRVAHIERLLTVDLDDLDTIVDLRLGLHAAELLGEPLA